MEINNSQVPRTASRARDDNHEGGMGLASLGITTLKMAGTLHKEV